MQEKILWIDDEIDMLKPHIIFLQNKGYELTSCNNASDGIEKVKTEFFDAVLLDENMPGIGGLEALQLIKSEQPNLPVIMITKNEEEHIMEEAIGQQIADYILKPVNPNQVLLSLKKVLKSDKLIEEKTVNSYQQEFRQISMDLMNVSTYDEWIVLYQKLINWSLRLDKIEDEGLLNILETQKEEANKLFAKFIEKNYQNWLASNDKPLLSHIIFKEKVKPLLEKKEKVLLLMIDNLRYDQWKVIEPLFAKYYKKSTENQYYSILPTATQYARNSFFAGLLPLEIEKKYSNFWLNDVDDGNKNQFEQELLAEQLKRFGLSQLKTKYFKILNSDFERKIYDDFNQYKSADFVTIVYNFIDILSHAKTDNTIVNELIRDEKTYRSLTYNWIENSSILKIAKLAAENNFKLIITTDHGTVFVRTPSKVIADRETSTNLRYKLGKNLDYEAKDVFTVSDPEKFYLPKVNVSSKYIFAKEDVFFAYPKNYNQYVNYYKNTLQHGGISLEEIICPFIVLEN